MKNIDIYIDGGCGPTNPGWMGIGVWCRKPRIRVFSARGWGTSNQAEYLALIEALNLLTRRPATTQFITIRTDSELLMKQMRGIYGVHNQRLRELKEEAQELASKLCFPGIQISYEWIPREENEEADALATEGVRLARKEGSPSKPLGLCKEKKSDRVQSLHKFWQKWKPMTAGRETKIEFKRDLRRVLCRDKVLSSPEERHCYVTVPHSCKGNAEVHRHD